MRSVLGILILAPVFAQTSPDAAALLRQSVTALQQVRSFEIQQETILDANIPVMTTHTQAVNPGKVRMEVKTAGITTAIMISDGNNAWMYIPIFKEYSKIPPGDSDLQDIRGGFGMTPGVDGIAEMSKSAKVAGSETLDVDGQPHDCWVIQGPAGAQQPEFTWWIDKTLGIALKISISQKRKAGAGAPMAPGRSVTTTRSLKLNEDFPDSLFVFTPPADAKESDDLPGAGGAAADADAPPPGKSPAEESKSPAPGEPEAFVPYINPIDRIEPVYPPDARAKGLQGVVETLVTIDPAGSVVNQEPLSGPALLRPAAAGAIKQWKFRPVYRNGHPVSAYTKASVTFLLDGDPKNSSGLNIDFAEQEASAQRVEALKARFPRSPQQVAADSEDQIRDADAETRFYALPDLAKQELEAGAVDKAFSYATELLRTSNDRKDDWNYGNAVFTANTVLGRIALKQGSVAQARLYLLESGKTPGSPTLDSFGPDFTLARELLDKGERDAVIDFLISCKSFWKMGGEALDSMIAAVKSGGTF